MPSEGKKLPEALRSETPHPAASLLETQVYQELLSRIHDGTYALGDRLPPEHDLAAGFGVSRPVVRAALARLRESGLITSRRGAGSFVASGETAAATGFSAFAGIDQIAAYFEFRRTVECDAARLAALRAPERADELAAVQDSLRMAIETGAPTSDFDLRFHTLLAEMSGNVFLLESLRMLRPHGHFIGNFVRSLSPAGYQDAKRRMNREHDEIIAAVAAGDGPRAARAMRNHIEASERRVFKGG